jgi:hypothetical protein
MATRPAEIMERDRNPHPPAAFADKNVFTYVDEDQIERFSMDVPATWLKVHIGELERDINDPIHLQ